MFCKARKVSVPNGEKDPDLIPACGSSKVPVVFLPPRHGSGAPSPFPSKPLAQVSWDFAFHLCPPGVFPTGSPPVVCRSGPLNQRKSCTPLCAFAAWSFLRCSHSLSPPPGSIVLVPNRPSSSAFTFPWSFPPHTSLHQNCTIPPGFYERKRRLTFLPQPVNLLQAKGLPASQDALQRPGPVCSPALLPSHQLHSRGLTAVSLAKKHICFGFRLPQMPPEGL